MAHRIVTYSDSNCDIPKNRPDYSNGFIGATSIACENVTSKIATEGDQITMDANIQDYINSKGYRVLYYPYLYEIEQSEKIHGEHSAAEYGKPFFAMMMLEIKDAPSNLAVLGFENEETVTAWLHIKTFRNLLYNIVANPEPGFEEYQKVYHLPYYKEGSNEGSQMVYDDITKALEPKPKDLFQLTTFGCDREWDRGNRIYEITNVEDEIFSEKYNIAFGHYVWKITAKRYRYSFETGTSQADDKASDNLYLGFQGEKGNHQVHDNEPLLKMFLKDKYEMFQYGKVYKEDIELESKNEFDMSVNIENVYYDELASKANIVPPQKEENEEENESSSHKIESNGWF